ncbi:MAG: hypothetical protein HY544_05755 [Candidatus Diapherotrites archaeon]|uniref:Uncharacterized protein n=1 Tax=Candidatus Iainarchaeum sp. TaxID=3101447 RepID=A0A8T3YP07_9ARCH|nr:hypothetical protein [Candidatus Diapherotrites archaeon]
MEVDAGAINFMKREEALEAIGKKNWKKFLQHMRGQTLGINSDGSTEYYQHDVERFLLLQSLPPKKRGQFEQLLWD